MKHLLIENPSTPSLDVLPTTGPISRFQRFARWSLSTAGATVQQQSPTHQGSYNSEVIDLDAFIIPAKTAAGVSIGSAVSELLATIRPQSTTKLSDGEKCDFGAIKIWAKNGTVTQIGVYSGYRGTLQATIRIGSTIADVEDCFGCPVEEDEEDNLVVPTSPGWCFGTEEWENPQTVSNNRKTRIAAIFVFKTD